MLVFKLKKIKICNKNVRAFVCACVRVCVCVCVRA